MLNKSEVHILYVEDELTNRFFISRMLKMAGYEKIELAENATQALEFLKNPEIKLDIILMDLGLPDLSGTELTYEIRHSQWPSKNIPIIAVTSNEAESARQESFAAGMNDFLTKPVSTDILDITIQKALAA